jgi:hypothetical protein
MRVCSISTPKKSVRATSAPVVRRSAGRTTGDGADMWGWLLKPRVSSRNGVAPSLRVIHAHNPKADAGRRSTHPQPPPPLPALQPNHVLHLRRRPHPLPGEEAAAARIRARGVDSACPSACSNPRLLDPRSWILSVWRCLGVGRAALRLLRGRCTPYVSLLPSRWR